MVKRSRERSIGVAAGSRSEIVRGKTQVYHLLRSLVGRAQRSDTDSIGALMVEYSRTMATLEWASVAFAYPCNILMATRRVADWRRRQHWLCPS